MFIMSLLSHSYDCWMKYRTRTLLKNANTCLYQDLNMAKEEIDNEIQKANFLRFTYELFGLSRRS